MILIQKDGVCLSIDERVLAEHQRLGWVEVQAAQTIKTQTQHQSDKLKTTRKAKSVAQTAD